jgi:glycosyltransferase involved in cell wall biosynthesis
MSGRPLVTVIIPVYNGTNYLAEAVESVLAQSLQKLELVVVDDGSTDGTWRLIESFGDRLRGFRKANGGVASALNRGIVEARGRFIAWLSHDDSFLPDKTERQLELMRRSPHVGACYTDYRITDPEGHTLREIRTPWYPRLEMRRRLFGSSFINGSTMLIDRRCFDELGSFSEELRYTQDVDMWLRILDRYEIGRVAEVLGIQRSHPEQGSRSEGPHIAEEQQTFGRVFDRLGASGLFPETAGARSPERATARAHLWYGDTVAYGRLWYEVADRHYREAAAAWPSWSNPARLRVLLGSRFFTAPRRALRRLRVWAGGQRRRLLDQKST